MSLVLKGDPSSVSFPVLSVGEPNLKTDVADLKVSVDSLGVAAIVHVGLSPGDVAQLIATLHAYMAEYDARFEKAEPKPEGT